MQAYGIEAAQNRFLVEVQASLLAKSLDHQRLIGQEVVRLIESGMAVGLPPASPLQGRQMVTESFRGAGLDILV